MAPYLGDRAAEFIEENRRPPLRHVRKLRRAPFTVHRPVARDVQSSQDLPVGPTFLKKPEDASLLHRVKADYYLKYLEGGDPSEDPYMTTWAAVGEDVTSELGWRTLRAHYFASISLVDTMVGKIIGALERSGLTENTIVVFTSDHGDLLGRPRHVGEAVVL